MKSIDDIRSDLVKRDFVHSIHSASRVIERNISSKEIAKVGENAIIIEDYPDDRISPSSLVLGFTDEGNPLHIILTRDQEYKMKIISIYEPNPQKWKNGFKERVL